MQVLNPVDINVQIENVKQTSPIYDVHLLKLVHQQNRIVGMSENFDYITLEN